MRPPNAPALSWAPLRVTASIAVLGTAIVVGACSDSTGPEGLGGIQFISGNNTDTARAKLTQALVVEVRDSSGRLASAGTVVRFESVASTGFIEALVGPLTSPVFSTFATDETDDNGRAVAVIQLGQKAGPARVVVSVPTLGLVDTARFTVTAGNAANIVIDPPDTLLYVGRSFTARGAVTDASGNPRTEPVTWSTSGAGLSVTGAGVVTASAFGRHTFTATAGSFSTTASVSVVPQLQLAAWERGSASNIVSMELDGSNKKVLASVQDGGIGAHPQWVPGTNTIIYTTMVGAEQRIRIVDQNGAVTPFIASPPATMSHQAEPAPTSSGNWIFFSAHEDSCGGGGDYCLHRAALNGSSPTLLVTGDVSRQPAPSPDGLKVAFTRSDFSGEIRVLDVATNTVSSLSVSGQYPAWSPLGTKIAYVSGSRIYLVNPDGSESTPLTGTQRAYSSSAISWSPDGSWIIARSSSTLDLIEVATGMTLPLPATQFLFAPSLK